MAATRWAQFRRWLTAFALVITLGAAGLTTLLAPAATAATGLRVLPASGSTNGVPISLEIPGSCPAATDSFIVEAIGGGFPTGSFMIGYNTLEPGQTTFNAGGDWKAIAGNNQGTLPLQGTTNLRFVCLTGQEPAGAEYTTTVAFTPTTGTDSTFVAAVDPAPPCPTATPYPVCISPTPTTLPCNAFLSCLSTLT